MATFHARCGPGKRYLDALVAGRFEIQKCACCARGEGGVLSSQITALFGTKDTL